MEPLTLLRRVLTKPTPGDLLSLQTIVLSCEEKAASPLKHEQAETALALLGDFYAYLVGLESKLEAHAFAELASKMDMGAVGGVVVENMLSAGEKLLERILVGGFSEALMVLASRQYVKAFKRTRAGRCYSYLSATIGSTFVARQAGRRHAISTVPASTSVTSPNVTGSDGLTP